MSALFVSAVSAGLTNASLSLQRSRWHGLADSEGTELLNCQEARIESIRYIGQLLQDDARRIRMDHGWHMEVTDNSGLVLFRLDINLMNTAATLSERPRPHQDR